VKLPSTPLDKKWFTSVVLYRGRGGNKVPWGTNPYSPYNMESLINKFGNKYVYVTTYLKLESLKQRTIT